MGWLYPHPPLQVREWRATYIEAAVRVASRLHTFARVAFYIAELCGVGKCEAIPIALS